MAELALGAVGLGYPIAKDIAEIVSHLKKAYNGVKYAKKDLLKVIKRTDTFVWISELFGETMKKSKKMKALAPTFLKYSRLNDRLRKESRKIRRRLRDLREIFFPLLTEDPVLPAKRFYAQAEWYRFSKDSLPVLFDDMKVLRQSMHVMATLINIRITQGLVRESPSYSVSILYESFQRDLDLRLLKLERAWAAQQENVRHHPRPESQTVAPEDFARQVLDLVREGMEGINSGSESVPSSYRPSPSTPPGGGGRSPSTPPSSPPTMPTKDPVIVEEPYQDTREPQPSNTRPPSPYSQEPPIPFRNNFCPSSAVSYVNIQELISPQLEVFPEDRFMAPVDPQPCDGSDNGDLINPPPTTLAAASPSAPERGEIGEEIGPYMQMPPFGPPVMGPRPSPGRTSSPSSRESVRRVQRNNSGGSRSIPRLGEIDTSSSSPRERRRSGYPISEYGDGGEITSGHMMHSIRNDSPGRQEDHE